MRDYAKVLPAFWTGETGKRLRALGRDVQVVAFYLMTSPHSNMTGLYHLPLVYLSHDTGIPLEGASKALRSLIEEGFCHYDEPSEVVFVRELARINVGWTLSRKDNRHKGLVKELEKYRKCKLIRLFWERYGEPFNLAPLEPLRSPSEAPPKPVAVTVAVTGGGTRARARAPDPPGTKKPPDPDPSDPTLSAFAVVEREFAGFRKRATSMTWRRGAKDYAHIEAAAEAVGAEASASSRPFLELVRRSLDGYERDAGARDKGYPLGFWAHDPLSFIVRGQLGAAPEAPADPLLAKQQQLQSELERAQLRGDPRESERLQEEIWNVAEERRRKKGAVA